MEEFITWRESFSVKIPSIDKQHGKLVEMVNELYKHLHQEITDEFLSKLLKQLEDYSEYHFNHEEELMQQYNFSGYDEHKTAHEQFKEKIAHYKQNLSAQDSSELIDFATFLKNWLLQHIMGMDKKYSELFLEKGVE